jgi:hypothetical protein
MPRQNFKISKKLLSGFLTHARVRNKSQAQWAGRAQWGSGFGAFPGYDNPTRTHAAEGQAERSGQAKRSKKGDSAIFPDYGHPSRMHAEEGQAEYSGQAERS